MTSIRDPVAYFIAGMPQNISDLRILIDAWTAEINTDIGRRESASPSARMAWMRSFQAVTLMQTLIKTNSTFSFKFMGMAHTCVFKYQLILGECVFDMLVRWKTKLRFNFVRVSPLSELTAQCGNCITDAELSSSQYLEELFFDDEENLREMILRGGLLPVTKRIPFGEMTYEYLESEKIAINRPGLNADIYVSVYMPELRRFFVQFTLDSQISMSMPSIPLSMTHTLDADCLERLTSLLCNITNAASSAISSFTRQGVALISGLVAIWRNWHDTVSVSAILIGLCATLGLSGKIVGYVVDMSIARLFVNTLCAQGGGPTPLDAVPIISVLGVLLSAYAYDKVPSEINMDGMCKKLNLLGRGMQGAGTLFTFFEKNLTKVMEIIYDKLFGIPYGCMSMDQYVTGIEAWCKDVTELAKWETMELLAVDAELCERIDRVHSRGLEISSQMTQLKVPSSILAMYSQYQRTIVKVHDRILNFGRRKYEARIEPVVVQFYGEAGVGKSCLTRLFAQDMMLLEEQETPDGPLMADNIETHLYFRNAGQGFWDGYKGQYCCVYDDWAQLKDSVANPNEELIEIIKCVNVAEYPLRMADLAEKSRSSFRSRLLILTSNAFFPYVESITKPAAVKRRRDLVMKVTIDPKYARVNGMVDPTKVTSSLDPNIYRFDLMDSMDGNKILERNISYAQFLAHASALYSSKRHLGEDRQQLLRERAQRSRDARLEKAGDQYSSCASLVPMQSQINVDDVYLTIPPGYVIVGRGAEVLDYIYRVSRVNPRLEGRVGGMEAALYIRLARFAVMVSEAEYWDHAFAALDDLDVDIGTLTLHAPDVSFVGRWRNAISSCTLYGTQRRLKQWGSELIKELKLFGAHLKAQPWYARLDLIYSFVGIVTVGVIMGKVAGVLFGQNDELKPEAASNDNRTRSARKLRTEAASNDNRTTTARRMRTEAASNDNRTTTARRLEAQFRDGNYGMSSEAALDPNQKELIACAVYRNVYKVSAVRDGRTTVLYNAFFIKGRCAMIPSHGFYRLQQANDVVFSNAGMSEGYTFPGDYFCGKENYTELVDASGRTKDAIMIVLPRGFPSQRDLTPHIVRQCDLGSYQSFIASIPLLNQVGNKWVHTVYANIRATVDTKAVYTYTLASGKEGQIALRHSYMYDTDTDKGDCGAPLVVANTALARKIVGFHVAGGRGVGCATSFTLEDVKALLRHFPLEAQIHLDFEDVVSDDCTLPEGDFIPIGKIGRNYAPALKSALRESPLHGALDQITTAPSALRAFRLDGELIDPLSKGLKKCGVSQKWIDPEDVQRATQHFANLIFSSTNASLRRVLTYEEGIVGTDDLFLDPINRRSSPGYPWINKKKSGTVGKTGWLGDGDYDLTNVELKNAVTSRIDQARLGRRQPVYWIDTLKDERRPLDKVAAGKTRVFAAGAQDYILAFRMYFLGFNAHVMQNMISNEVAVGINPYSGDWHRLSKALLTKGDKVVAGDFANFDGTLNSQIMHGILDMVNEWYDDGPENCLIRTVLWEDIVSSIHIYRDNLYQWTHSQPSGNPMTVILNSCYNSISMRIVWLNTMKDTEYRSLTSFTKEVCMISYGDDNVLNISDNVIDLFNQVTIGEGYEKIGMKYTMEDKGDSNIPFRSLDQVNFLKRSFTWDDVARQYHGCLEMSVIMEMINWVRGTLNIEESTIENIAVAMHELSLYPESVYNTKMKQIKNACRIHLRKQPPFQSWVDSRMEQ